MIVLGNVLAEVGMPAAVKSLQEGQSALDAIEQGIRPVEANSKVKFVGRGGDPNLLGVMECDAAIMDGANLNSGAVGALKEYLHAISLARRVMDELPHVLLVGEGASRFAAECGMEQTEMLTAAASADHRKWLEEHVPADVLARWPDVPLAPHTWPSANPANARGTTVFVAIDERKNIAAGTSTSGWSYKYPGRLGDSPIVGAGLYAHNQAGACVCTHTGEMTIRANTAASVVRYMKAGASVGDACGDALDDLRELKDGYLGPVVIHAIDRQGAHHVVSTCAEEETPMFWLWTSELGKIERRKPVVVRL